MTKEHARVFLTRAGRNGEEEELALDLGIAVIGFLEVPSLAAAKEYADVFKIVEKDWVGATPRAVGNKAGQLWAFALSMQEGDIVVLPRKRTSQIALGRIKGPYEYRKVGSQYRHVRSVEWVRPDAPRTAFEQDLLYSFGAFMTVCQISRNDAERRVATVLAGKTDPGPLVAAPGRAQKVAPSPAELESEVAPDLLQHAHDQIIAHIQARFAGHALSRLVEAVLRADGWVTKNSPPGADGGVDIFAGRGSLGLDAPRLCVQVKSQPSAADVTVYRTLQGTMQAFKAEQGLLVCWGGVNKAVLAEARQSHFTVRIWDSRDLVEAIYRTYEQLPAEIQAELPLKRVWMLVPGKTEE
jgi:restriction system protein